jgi:hypothetical protein
MYQLSSGGLNKGWVSGTLFSNYLYKLRVTPSCILTWLHLIHSINFNWRENSKTWEQYGHFPRRCPELLFFFSIVSISVKVRFNLSAKVEFPEFSTCLMLQ